MGPVAAIRDGFRNYVRFSGSASRSDFWWFAAFLLLGGIAVSALVSAGMTLGQGIPAVRTDVPYAADQRALSVMMAASVASLVFFILCSLPMIDVAARRFRDASWSPLWLLLPTAVQAAAFAINAVLFVFTIVGALSVELGAVIAAGIVLIGAALSVLALSFPFILCALPSRRPADPASSPLQPA